MIISNLMKKIFLLVSLSAGVSHFCWAQQSASASFLSSNASAEIGSMADAKCLAAAQKNCLEFPKKVVAPKKKSLPPPAKSYDPLAVHSEFAIKETKPVEINLPGVMKIAGVNSQELDFSKARVIAVNNGGSQAVYLSSIDQNRIQLPWPNSKVVGTGEVDIDKNSTSNNVYVQFKEGVTRSVQLYFEQPGGGSVLGVQIIPKTIPAQTIIVKDDSVLVGESIKAPKGNDYVSQTQSLLEIVALGGAPQGFSQLDLHIPPIIMNGLVVTPEKQFSSVDRDIFIYDVVNPSTEKAIIKEQEFDGDDVLAISIFPKPILTTNEHCKVIVVARKQVGK